MRLQLGTTERSATQPRPLCITLRRSIIMITNNPSHLGVITWRGVALARHSARRWTFTGVH